MKVVWHRALIVTGVDYRYDTTTFKWTFLCVPIQPNIVFMVIDI